MYFSFIRNRRQRKKTYIFKLAIIAVAFMLLRTVLTVIFNINIVENGMNIVADAKDKVIYSVLKVAVKDVYGLGDYRENSTNTGLSAIIDEGINKSSNLYAYVDEKNKKIDLAFYDLSYTYANISDTISVSTKDTNTEEGETVKENVAEGNENDGKPEYVAPASTENGIRYSMEQLSDFSFLMNKLYIVPSRAKVLEEELNAEEMLGIDMKLKQDNSKPQILIYHTHSQEGFVDSVKGKPETYIVGVGEYLCKLLTEEYGYNVIHCKEQFDIKNGKLDRSKAYTYAETTLNQILEDYPSIEVVLDIHRDGLPEGADKLVTDINGKQTAKIMFFNGVSRSSTGGDIDYLFNRFKKENLAFSFQLKLKAMENYPDFTRKNYIDAYQYNQHLRGKSVLVEVGAQNNTLQEELNAMEVLAEVLHKVIN
ncbi:MAG: stage II sporulation protein P [Lachnospiraceae bacterium]|nr:stage II sporulation protein P [Lachnospiraceae bacterium]